MDTIYFELLVFSFSKPYTPTSSYLFPLPRVSRTLVMIQPHRLLQMLATFLILSILLKQGTSLPSQDSQPPVPTYGSGHGDQTLSYGSVSSPQRRLGDVTVATSELATAYNNATQGDTITLTPGSTFSQSGRFTISKGITIICENPTTSSKCTMSGLNDHPVFFVNGVSSGVLYLTSLVITNGLENTNYGGGIRIQDSTAVLTNLNIINNQCTGSAEGDAIKAACDAYNNHSIRIYTVGFGSDANETSLIEMASCGQGSYYNTVDDLITIYQEIANEMQAEKEIIEEEKEEAKGWG